jgi:predicted outer membrane repeat protein
MIGRGRDEVRNNVARTDGGGLHCDKVAASASASISIVIAPCIGLDSPAHTKNSFH